MTIPLFMIGFLSLLGQTTLLREMNVAFYGIELIYLLALAIWLFLAAVGALIGRREDELSRHHVMVLFSLFGMTLLASIVFARAGRILLGGIPGAYLSFPRQLLVLLISLLPTGILSGLLFQRAAKLYVADKKGRTLASAYGIESAGSLAGGLLATAGLHYGIQNFTLAVACALLAFVTAAVLPSGQKETLRRSFLCMSAGILLILLFFASSIDRLMTAWNHPGLLVSRDSPYGRITVTQLAGQTSVFENDELSFETEGTHAEHFVHLSALQHPNPESILILGGGAEGIVKEILQHNPKRIDYVEINSIMINEIIPQLPNDITASLRDPLVHLTIADPRRFLEESGRCYDLILVGMPDPSSGQTNRFYTKDFFMACEKRLNPQGILSLRLRSSENFWTPQLVHRTASIYRALVPVFSEVLLLPGTIDIVAASPAPLPDSPEILVERFKTRQLQTRLLSPSYLRYLYKNDRFLEIRGRLKASKASANTDVRPACYSHTLMIWLSKFFPKMTFQDLSVYWDETLKPRQWLLRSCIVISFFIARQRPALRRTLLVFMAGFLGMVIESVLVLHYQVKQGVLFQDIGLLFTMFMAGLASGSLLFNRIMTSSEEIKHGQTRRWGAGLLAGFVLLCLPVIVMTRGDQATLVQTVGFLTLSGFITAGLFTYASLHEIEDQKKVISPLYAADLLGGCLGSLLAGLFLIPLLGLDATTLWTVFLAAFSGLLV